MSAVRYSPVGHDAHVLTDQYKNQKVNGPACIVLGKGHQKVLEGCFPLGLSIPDSH